VISLLYKHVSLENKCFDDRGEKTIIFTALKLRKTNHGTYLNSPSGVLLISPLLE
jgi:hypothetical protein